MGEDAAPTQLTAEMISDARRVSGVRLNPDGTLTAYVVAPVSRREKHPVSAIWLANATAPARQLTAGSAEDTSPRWSGDGHTLYFLSDLSAGVTGEIHHIDAGYNIISMPRPEDMKAAINGEDDGA